MTDQERLVVDEMASSGGGFVQALAKCFILADPANFVTLQHAFPEYWRRYESIVLQRKLKTQ